MGWKVDAVHSAERRMLDCAKNGLWRLNLNEKGEFTIGHIKTISIENVLYYDALGSGKVYKAWTFVVCRSKFSKGDRYLVGKALDAILFDSEKAAREARLLWTVMPDAEKKWKEMCSKVSICNLDDVDEDKLIEVTKEEV